MKKSVNESAYVLTDDGNIGDNVGVCALKCPKRLLY